MAAEALPLRARGTALTVLIGAATLYLAKIAAPVVVPILVSVLLAYALEPLVETVMRCRVPRIVAAATVYVLLGLLGGALVRSGAGPFQRFLDDLPRTIASLTAALSPADGTRPSTLTKLQHAATEIERTAAGAAPAAPPGVRRVTIVPHRFDIREYLVKAGRGALATGIDLLVVVLLTFLLLATGDLYKRKLVKLGGPTLEQKKVTVEVIRSIDRQIERYLIARLLISVIVAALTAAGLWALGVNDALVWGLIHGALNVLPFVGSGASIAMIALAAFVQFHSLPLGGAAGGITLGVAMLEANAITPWLTSRAGDLNTVAVFAGVLFWGWLWDFWGLVLAVPIMVAVKAAADHIEMLAPIGELLGE